MKTITKTVRVGRNRGKPRLWLEGAWLADLGFGRGTKFVAIWTSTAIILRNREDYGLPRTGEHVAGERTVSGKGDRPIIDIAGARLEPWAGSDLTLTGRPGLITIRRA